MRRGFNKINISILIRFQVWKIKTWYNINLRNEKTCIKVKFYQV
jgi:hypothetical protein